MEDRDITRHSREAVVATFLRLEADEDISMMVSSAKERIRSGEINICINTFAPNRAPLTIFRPIPIASSKGFELVGQILVHPGSMFDVSNDFVAADLVRTLAVIDQFPYNGYQNQLLTVYKKAFDVQKAWLQNKHFPDISFDPRTKTFKDLIFSFIEKPYIFTDIGFEDWNKAVEDIRESESYEQDILMKFQASPTPFILARERLVPTIYPLLVSRFGEQAIHSWMGNKRKAQEVAKLMVGMSLHAEIMS